MASASARVSAIEAALPPLRIALAAREHRLAVLTGTAPGQLAVDLAPRAYPPLAKAIAARPARSSCSSRRPDVRAAERRLAAMAAREGVAAADLYPRITISGVLGLLAGRGSLFGTKRLARLGGDSGAAVERLRPRQRPGPPARRPRPRPRKRSPTTTGRCCWRSRRPRHRW